MNIKELLYRKAPVGIKPNLSYLNYRFKSPFELKKDFNMVKYLMQRQKKQITYTPPMFVVSISMKCNLRCPTCLYLLQSPDNLDDSGYINVDDFENMIGKYAHIVETCGLSGGEALLHPELGKLLEITKKKNLPTSITTNGIAIKNRIDILRSYDLESLSISVDAYNYETFRMYRGGTKKQFDSIVEGLSLLKTYNIDFILSFLLTAQNVSEIGKMIEFAYKVSPKIASFYSINPHGDERYTPLTMGNEECLQIMKGIISKTDYPFNIELPVIFDINSKCFKSAKCSLPWHCCTVGPNGNIAPCCHLMHSEEYGNIFKGYDFNSDKMMGFREIVMGEEPLGACVYCYRRFMGDEFGTFDAKAQRWILR